MQVGGWVLARTKPHAACRPRPSLPEPKAGKLGAATFFSGFFFPGFLAAIFPGATDPDHLPCMPPARTII